MTYTPSRAASEGAPSHTPTHRLQLALEGGRGLGHGGPGSDGDLEAVVSDGGLQVSARLVTARDRPDPLVDGFPALQLVPLDQPVQVLKIKPPLAFTEADADRLVDALPEAFADETEKGGRP